MKLKTLVLVITFVIINSCYTYAQNIYSSSGSTKIENLNIVWNIGETITGGTKNTNVGGIIQIINSNNNEDSDELLTSNTGLLDFQIRAFPNPTKNKLIVKFENTTSLIEISIINNNGQIVDTIKTLENRIQYDFTDTPEGIYLLLVKEIKTNNTKTIKILKK